MNKVVATYPLNTMLGLEVVEYLKSHELIFSGGLWSYNQHIALSQELEAGMSNDGYHKDIMSRILTKNGYHITQVTFHSNLSIVESYQREAFAHI